MPLRPPVPLLAVSLALALVPAHAHAGLMPECIVAVKRTAQAAVRKRVEAAKEAVQERVDYVKDKIDQGKQMYATARDTAVAVKDNAVYAKDAALVISKEITKIQRWAGKAQDTLDAINGVVKLYQEGKYFQIPEESAKLLRVSKELVDEVEDIWKRLPPGTRKDAYGVVLHDAKTLYSAAVKTIEFATGGLSKADPALRAGINKGIEAGQVAWEKGKGVVETLDQANQKLQAAKAKVIATRQGLVDRVDGAVGAVGDTVDRLYDNAYLKRWNQYLSEATSSTESLTGRVDIAMGLGRKVDSTRSDRYVDAVAWARDSYAPLGAQVPILRRKTHPVLSYFISDWFRERPESVVEYFSEEWPKMSKAQRASEIDALRFKIDSLQDALLLANSEAVKPFVREIDPIKKFLGYWQDMTPTEKDSYLMVLFDLPPSIAAAK